MLYLCHEITYAEIEPYWDKLWLGRTYEPTSAMCYLGGYHAWAPKKACYYAITDEQGKTCGVNSCHDTGNLLVRSRGLWVDPAYRGQGLGQKLLEFAVDWTKANGYSALWSYPKLSAWNTYRSVGFERQLDWQTDPDTKQQNCYAIRFI